MNQRGNHNFYNAVEANPIIAAVKNMDDVENCCRIEEIKVVFILFGDICSLEEIINKIKKAGKTAVVHVDLINGLSSKEIAVEYIKKNTAADGIISTKISLIKKAKEEGLYTVLRYFLLDSMAVENIRQQNQGRPDFLEGLPGVMPKVVGELYSFVKVPIIAGGLIVDKEDVMEALDAGAMAVSTTNHQVWKM